MDSYKDFATMGRIDLGFEPTASQRELLILWALQQNLDSDFEGNGIITYGQLAHVGLRAMFGLLSARVPIEYTLPPVQLGGSANASSGQQTTPHRQFRPEFPSSFGTDAAPIRVIPSETAPMKTAHSETTSMGTKLSETSPVMAPKSTAGPAKLRQSAAKRVKKSKRSHSSVTLNDLSTELTLRIYNFLPLASIGSLGRISRMANINFKYIVNKHIDFFDGNSATWKEWFPEVYNLYRNRKTGVIGISEMLIYAIPRDFTGFIDRLLSQYNRMPNRDGKALTDPLYVAINHNNTGIVEQLIELGCALPADIYLHFANTGDKNMLHLALCNAVPDRVVMQQLLYRSVMLDKYDCVRLLCEFGAQINEFNPDDGKTPLHHAVYGGYNTASYLIENGAMVDIQDNDGNTPFLCAIEELQKRYESFDQSSVQRLVAIIELLLKNGANISRQNKLGFSFIDCKLKEKDYLHIKHLADVEMAKQAQTAHSFQLTTRFLTWDTTREANDKNLSFTNPPWTRQLVTNWMDAPSWPKPYETVQHEPDAPGVIRKREKRKHSPDEPPNKAARR